MSPTPIQGKQKCRVLLTGFGPFHQYKVNPAWLAVLPLHNQTLTMPPPPLDSPLDAEEEEDRKHGRKHNIRAGDDDPSWTPASSSATRYRDIEMSIDIIDVSYREVLDRVPPFHSLPPSLNSCSSEHAVLNDAGVSAGQQQQQQYDLVVHVGVGKPAEVKLEGTARRWGYNSLDVEGGGCHAALEHGREGARRGLAGREWEGLETSASEKKEEALRTIVKREVVIDWVKGKGVDSLRTSEDAGLYLCEFVYYTSLASARRQSRSGTPEVPVMFIHVPPPDMPYSIEQMTKIVRLVTWATVNEGGLDN